MARDHAVVNTKCITINPEAPDDFWVSPSGSDCWCRVGELKAVLNELEFLRAQQSELVQETARRCVEIAARLSVAGECHRGGIVAETIVKDIKKEFGL